MLAEIPERARDDSDVLKGVIDNLHVRVTGSDTWRFEASGFGILYISRRALECLWVFVYGHLVIYAKSFEGKSVFGDIDIARHPELELPRAMLTWLHSDIALTGEPMPSHFPAPSQTAARESVDGVAFRLTLHAIRFHIFHELAHIVFARVRNRPAALRDEEQACDLTAIRWVNSRNATDFREREGTKTGAATALLYLAAYGIDTGRHEGINHPRSYHRLIETLKDQYGAREDRVWGPVLTILATHCTNMRIEIKWAAEGYNSFRDAALFVQQTIDEFVDARSDRNG